MIGERPFRWEDSLDQWLEMSVRAPCRRGVRNETGQRVECGLLSLWESRDVPFELEILPVRNKGRFLIREQHGKMGMTMYGKQYLSSE